MGELLRRFWLPAMLPDELPEADSAPVRLRLLGEDLIAFRDTNGRIGVVTEQCAHRGASLFFGRNEECGLRCVYHGWKYDLTGQCVDMPNEPAESNFKEKIRLTAYPAQEYGGLIWVYMGPAEHVAQLPQLEWALLPDSHRSVSKWIQETNYMQGYEGDIDSSHSSFLHSLLKPAEAEDDGKTISALQKSIDKSPRIIVRTTDYGFFYGAQRAVGNGTFNWRITQSLLPTFSLIPFIAYPANARVWVPIDDGRTMTFNVSFNAEAPLTEKDREWRRQGRAFPPEILPGTFTPKRNASNDYLLDRELQRTASYTGIFGVNDQDRAIQESMAPIYDRRREHLGTADGAVIAARRNLLKLAKDLEQGIEPWLATHPEAYRVRSMDVNTTLADLDVVVNEHRLALQLDGAPTH
jgi:phthalate 4,5-dioxygenase